MQHLSRCFLPSHLDAGGTSERGQKAWSGGSLHQIRRRNHLIGVVGKFVEISLTHDVASVTWAAREPVGWKARWFRWCNALCMALYGWVVCASSRRWRVLAVALGVPIVFSDVSLSRCVRTALYYAGSVEETRMMLCLLGRRRRRQEDDDDDDYYSCDPPAVVVSCEHQELPDEWMVLPMHTALSLIRIIIVRFRWVTICFFSANKIDFFFWVRH